MQKPANPEKIIVTPKTWRVNTGNGKIPLENGEEFGPVDITYETYGILNRDKSNAVLILHAFSGDAHAAGYHRGDDKHPGWWDTMIGPGKAFDTKKYHIICANILGGCRGTTGPGSVSPETGKPYGLSFPVITIEDMVNVQYELVRHLGIKKLLAVAGGSMGGMLALQWTISFPDLVQSAIILASTSRLSPQAIAFNAVGRNAITSDPGWQNGDYYGSDLQPARGLAIARMVGHITYLSDQSMNTKFGRRPQEKKTFDLSFNDQFMVESYLEHQGSKFVERFDANSYIYLSKAIDYFDLAQKYGSLDNALERTRAKFLIISYTSDWLFPTRQSKEMVFSLMRNSKDVSFTEIPSSYGHDAFLLETLKQEVLIGSFLGNLYGKV